MFRSRTQVAGSIPILFFLCMYFFSATQEHSSSGHWGGGGGCGGGFYLTGYNFFNFHRRNLNLVLKDRGQNSYFKSMKIFGIFLKFFL